MGPIVIAGVGGSGTRVIASMLQQAGVHLGPDLNHAEDNLWFTLMMKRPRWYPSPSERKQALDTFLDAMQGRLGKGHLRPVMIAAKDHMLWRRYSSRWIAKRISRMVRFDGVGPQPWGWKEPHTVRYVRDISAIPDVRYIHVMRNGLDMAFSGNQQQHETWGDRDYGIDRSLPYTRQSLNYWIRANNDAIAQGRELGDRFLLVNFDEFCAEPSRGVERLLEFAGLDGDIDGIASHVSPPSTLGRWRERDVSMFADDEIAAVADLGFSVD